MTVKEARKLIKNLEEDQIVTIGSIDIRKAFGMYAIKATWNQADYLHDYYAWDYNWRLKWVLNWLLSEKAIVEG